MALVKLKPTSAGRRHAVKVVSPELHKGKPFAALLEKKNRIAVIRVVATRRHIVSSTSSATRTVSPLVLNVLNTIRTVLLISLSCFMLTANVATSLPRRA